MIKFSIVTIFPDMIHAYLSASIMKRAIKSGTIHVAVHNLRDYTQDKHKSVDDYPYGGGAGMVMKAEPFFRMTEQLWPEKREEKDNSSQPAGTVVRSGYGRGDFPGTKRSCFFLRQV